MCAGQRVALLLSVRAVLTDLPVSVRRPPYRSKLAKAAYHEESVILIQAVVRGGLARVYYRQIPGWIPHIRLIQTAWRGYRGRQLFKPMREDWRRKMRKLARAQAVIRGALARQRFNQEIQQRQIWVEIAKVGYARMCRTRVYHMHCAIMEACGIPCTRFPVPLPESRPNTSGTSGTRSGLPTTGQPTARTAAADDSDSDSLADSDAASEADDLFDLDSKKGKSKHQEKVLPSRPGSNAPIAGISLVGDKHNPEFRNWFLDNSVRGLRRMDGAAFARTLRDAPGLLLNFPNATEGLLLKSPRPPLPQPFDYEGAVRKRLGLDDSDGRRADPESLAGEFFGSMARGAVKRAGEDEDGDDESDGDAGSAANRSPNRPKPVPRPRLGAAVPKPSSRTDKAAQSDAPAHPSRPPSRGSVEKPKKPKKQRVRRVKTDLDERRIDLIFAATKAKAGDAKERTLDFKTYVEALRAVAAARYPDMQFHPTYTGLTGAGKPAFSVDDAKLLYLIEQNLLRAPAAQPFVKALFQRVSDYMNAAARKMQNWWILTKQQQWWHTIQTLRKQRATLERCVMFNTFHTIFQ